MNLIKLDLTDLSVLQVIAKFQGILNLITTNAVFSSLAAKITALNTANAALLAANTAYDASLLSSDQKLTLRADARVAAENAARALASASEGVTQDPAALQSGGWEMRAAPSPVGLLPKPQGAAATIGDLEGTVDFHWDAIKRGVQTYLAAHATASDGPYTQFYVGKASKCVADGLVSGNEYWFQSRAVGAAGQGPWSDPAKCRAA